MFDDAMKILSGKYRNRNIFQPAHIRPTQNITRKAVFDLLGQDLEGLSFLDLFAGSGAVGLEALSLGAGPVVFVERDEKCCEVIRENLARLRAKEDPQSVVPAEVMNMDAFAGIKYLAGQGRRFDVVFMDPPYGQGHVKKALKTLLACDILHRNCFLIAEYGRRDRLEDFEDRLTLIKQRNYGTSHLAIFEVKK